MGKAVPKTSALVVSAIRKLREAQGSTSREIMNFITSEYDVPAGSSIKRQLQAALKRGLEYGILKRHQGHYTLSTDGGNGSCCGGGGGRTVGTIREDETGDLVDAGCHKKRRKYRKCKKTRRCARGCVPRRRKKKSCGRKRRRSRRKGGCPKRCGAAGGGGNAEVENLALNQLDECHNPDVKAQRSHHSSRSTRSRSQSRSQSRSRSRSRSGNSSRNGNRETSLERREKQTE